LKSKSGGSLAGNFGSSGRPSQISSRPSSSSSSFGSSKLSRSSSYGDFGGHSRYIQRGSLRPKKKKANRASTNDDMSLSSASGSDSELGQASSSQAPVAVRVSSSPITVPNDSTSRKERYIPLNTSSNPSYAWKSALLSCGSNHASQLGHDLGRGGKGTPFESKFKDVKTDGLTVRSVSIGGAYGFATTSNYALYGWGTGEIG